MSLIPRYIHQTWKTTDIPSVYRSAWLNSWIDCHPEWHYRLWTDHDLGELARQRFPEFYPIFASNTQGVVKSDFGRLLVLYEFGGIYADLDYACLRNFDNLLSRGDLIVSTMDASLKYIHNALVVSVPRHPLLASVLDRALSIWAAGAETRPPRIAGPEVFGAAVREYRQKDLYIAPHDLLCPLSWKTQGRAQRQSLHDLDSMALRKKYHEALAITFWTRNW
jgi:mannosyltransferase OCH1-like enzyme